MLPILKKGPKHAVDETNTLPKKLLFILSNPFVNHFAIEVQSMDVIEEYLLGLKSYRKLDAMADTPQQSTFFYVNFILAMEFRSDGAIFLLDSGKDSMYYLGSWLLSEMFVPFMKIFCSIQIYKKLTGRRRRNIVRVVIKFYAMYPIYGV